MTNLGLNYLAHKENERSNLAKEAETYRHNLATEGLSQASLDESKRHSIVSESETASHNRATEKQASLELGEKQRSNLVNEAELNRSHLVSEGETRRHNETTEAEAQRHNIYSEEFEQRTVSNNEVQTFLNNFKDNPWLKNNPWGSLIYGVATVATAGSKVSGFSGLGSAIQDVLETGSVDPVLEWLSKTTAGLKASDYDALSDMIADLTQIPRDAAKNIARELFESKKEMVESQVGEVLSWPDKIKSAISGFVDFIRSQFGIKAPNKKVRGGVS